VKGGLLPERIGLPHSVQKKQAAQVSYHRIRQSRDHRAVRKNWSPRAFAEDAQMAAGTRAAQCAHRNLDLSAQEPGPGGNRWELRRP